MVQEDTDNKLMIERYIREQLSPEDAAAFEEDFLGSSELLDQLEAAEKLEQGLHDLTTLEKSRLGHQRRGWTPSIFHRPQFAMAASFVLLISLGVSGVLHQRVGELEEALGTGGAAPAEIIPLVSVRGATGSDPVNTIRLDSGQQVYVLMLDPGFEAYARFRAAVFEIDAGDSGAPILQADHLTPGYEDMLALSIPASILRPGDFEIRIDGSHATEGTEPAFSPVDVITFRVLSTD